MIPVWSFPGLPFPIFALSKKIYSVNLRNQNKCVKKRTRKYRIHTLFPKCGIWKPLLIESYILVQLILLLIDQCLNHTNHFKMKLQ